MEKKAFNPDMTIPNIFFSSNFLVTMFISATTKDVSLSFVVCVDRMLV